MPTVKEDTQQVKVQKVRVKNPQGKTEGMLDDLLESVGLKKSEGGSA